MPDYVEYPIETDPDVLVSDTVAEIQTYFPNWEPNPTSLLYRAIVAICRRIAEGRDVAAAVPSEILRTAGRSLHNIPPVEPKEAVGETTWTMIDDAGYGPIPEGTVLSIDGILFETTAEVLVPSGSVSASNIGIRAIEPGSAASGLGAPGVEIDLEEAFAYVDAVTLNDATSNGVDGELNEEYQGRLRNLLILGSPKAILARDLALLAQYLIVGVDRAVAIDNYDAVNDLPNQPGHATVGVRAADGGDVPQPTKDEVTALLTGPSDRLLQTVIHVIDPTRTPVDITYDAIAYPEFDPSVVQANADAALAQFLDPADWGRSPTDENAQHPRWHNKTKVSIYDIAGVLDRVVGLDRVTNIQVGLDGGAQASDDADLPGVIPLPSVGAIAGNVEAPS